MSCESIMNPEMSRVKSDEFYLFYEMMMQSLKTDNVREGLGKSLQLLRSSLNSGNVCLYMNNPDGIYRLKESDAAMDDLAFSIGCIVNKTSSLTEQKKVLNLDLNLSDRLKNLLLLHVKLEECDCILTVVNNKEKELEPLFWDRVIDTMQIILKRAASYERNTAAITQDLLTGLDNRNSYEMRMKKIDEEDKDLVLGIFDLFRLKYVNDNYSHDVGDTYIKEAARILKKYWPKMKTATNTDGVETSAMTGHTVYRYGGDEFILLSSSEKLPLTSIKGSLAAEEAGMISLGIDEKIPLGLNYGVVRHEAGESMKETLVRADAIMQEDKKKMYVKHHLERRK